MQLLEYFPVFIAVGQLFIDFIYSFPSLLSLLVDLMSVLITGINFLLPGQRINEHFFPLKDDEKEMDYEDARIVFTSDYDLANPITKESAWNDWMALLKQRNYEKYQ